MELLPGKIHPQNLFYKNQDKEELRSPNYASCTEVTYRICHCCLGKSAPALLQSCTLEFLLPYQAAVFITLSNIIKKSSHFLFRDQQFNTQSKEKNQCVSMHLDVQPFCPYQNKPSHRTSPEESMAEIQTRQIITIAFKMVWQSFLERLSRCMFRINCCQEIIIFIQIKDIKLIPRKFQVHWKVKVDLL